MEITSVRGISCNTTEVLLRCSASQARRHVAGRCTPIFETSKVRFCQNLRWRLTTSGKFLRAHQSSKPYLTASAPATVRMGRVNPPSANWALTEFKRSYERIATDTGVRKGASRASHLGLYLTADPG